MFVVQRVYRFEAAHKLTDHPEPHSRLHGHSWIMVVQAQGPILHDSKGRASSKSRDALLTGPVMDAAVQPIVDQYLDYRYLNESLGLANPTPERIAMWAYQQIHEALRQQAEAHVDGIRLLSISIEETCSCGAIYEPDPTSFSEGSGNQLSQTEEEERPAQ